MTDNRAGQAFWAADDRIERLVRLRERGTSTAACAVELGTTKNAIVGMLDRLDMLQHAGPRTVPTTIFQRLDALNAELDRVLRETVKE